MTEQEVEIAVEMARRAEEGSASAKRIPCVRWCSRFSLRIASPQRPNPRRSTEPDSNDEAALS